MQVDRVRRVALNLLVAAATAAVVASAGPARADGPATRAAGAGPASKPTAEMTPKERMVDSVKTWPTMTPDAVAAEFYTTDADEQKLALSVAKQAIAADKLQAAVRAKWGTAGEDTVIHAAKSDSLSDDEASTEAIDGDRATITFADAGLEPVEMVKDHGVWKPDLHVLATKVGAKNLPAVARVNQKLTDVFTKAQADLDAGKFASADALAERIRADLGKLGG